MNRIISEKYDYKMTQKDLIDFAQEINSKIFNNEILIPKIVIKNNVTAGHLGRAVQQVMQRVSTGEKIREIWIEIQGRALQDPELAKQILAHELIHVWQFQQDDIEKVIAYMKFGGKEDMHGASFEKWMNKINAEYGENYVVKTGGYSEKAPSKDYYLVLEPSRANKDRIGYSIFVRPVPTLRDEIKKRLSQGRELRIIKTNDERWLSGEKFKPFGAIGIPKDEEDRKKLKELYDTGKQEIFEDKQSKELGDETEISKVDDDVYIELTLVENKEELTEMVITSADIQKAKEILGVDDTNIEDYKSKYRVLAHKYHPDRPEGDLDKMKSINWAKEVLDKTYTGKSPSAYNKVDWEEIDKKDREFSHFFTKEVKKFFEENADKYTEHFKRFVPKDYEFSIIAKEGEFLRTPVIRLTWSSPDKETVFNMLLTARRYAQTGLGTASADEIDFSLDAFTEMLHNNKTYKVHQQVWKVANKNLAALKDPENVFPEKALQRVAKQTRKSSKMQKRDFIAALEKSLDAKRLNDDEYQLRIKDDLSLIVKRTVLLRQPLWNLVGGIWKDKGQYSQTYYAPLEFKGYIPESEEGVSFLKVLLRELKAGSSNEDAVALARKELPIKESVEVEEVIESYQEAITNPLTNALVSNKTSDKYLKRREIWKERLKSPKSQSQTMILRRLFEDSELNSKRILKHGSIFTEAKGISEFSRRCNQVTIINPKQIISKIFVFFKERNELDSDTKTKIISYLRENTPSPENLEQVGSLIKEDDFFILKVRIRIDDSKYRFLLDGVMDDRGHLTLDEPLEILDKEIASYEDFKEKNEFFGSNIEEAKKKKKRKPITMLAAFYGKGDGKSGATMPPFRAPTGASPRLGASLPGPTGVNAPEFGTIPAAPISGGVLPMIAPMAASKEYELEKLFFENYHICLACNGKGTLEYNRPCPICEKKWTTRNIKTPEESIHDIGQVFDNSSAFIGFDKGWDLESADVACNLSEENQQIEEKVLQKTKVFDSNTDKEFKRRGLWKNLILNENFSTSQKKSLPNHSYDPCSKTEKKLFQKLESKNTIKQLHDYKEIWLPNQQQLKEAIDSFFRERKISDSETRKLFLSFLDNPNFEQISQISNISNNFDYIPIRIKVDKSNFRCTTYVLPIGDYLQLSNDYIYCFDKDHNTYDDAKKDMEKYFASEDIQNMFSILMEAELSWAEEVGLLKKEKENAIKLSVVLAQYQADFANIMKRLKDIKYHDMKYIQREWEKAAEHIRVAWVKVEKMVSALDLEVDAAKKGK